jgi:hypothetical protein
MYHVFFSATLSGKVVDEKGKPVAGANVFIEGTYDGASSAETVILVLQPHHGKQTLVVSFLIYETSKVIDVATFKIKPSNWESALDAVVITAEL